MQNNYVKTITTKKRFSSADHTNNVSLKTDSVKRRNQRNNKSLNRSFVIRTHAAQD